MTRFERLPKVHTIEREDKMNNYKSGFVTLIDESVDRTENRDHLQQTTDNAQSDSDCLYVR